MLGLYYSRKKWDKELKTPAIVEDKNNMTTDFIVREQFKKHPVGCNLVL